MKIWNLVALLAMLTGGLFISGCADSDAGTEGQATETAPEDPSDPAEDCPDGEDCDEQDGDSSSDSSDADDADPSDEEEVEETTGGLDCSTDEGLCEAPYECILGTCRIPISGISETEVEFTFAQPEELDEIFSLFKTFAAGLKFFALDVATTTAIPGRYSATYGSADIISEEPITISWQRPDEPEYLFFNPHVPATGPDRGTSWESETFTYKIRADADIQFGTFATTADIGLDILEAVVIHTQNTASENSVAKLTGLLTRAEAENRELGTHEELEGIMANFVCTEVSDYVPAPNSAGEVKWRLSDVLDCNLAQMDIDRSGDGVMDTYQVELDVVLGTAIIE
ncbi:MAG: hypothetical protein HOK97_06265 [Deltaproteobacteria bacterium]|jgi:hypothetical protein|nr:hypothetical protein [Deltaproteobacteria bacterium]